MKQLISTCLLIFCSTIGVAQDSLISIAKETQQSVIKQPGGYDFWLLVVVIIEGILLVVLWFRSTEERIKKTVSNSDRIDKKIKQLTQIGGKDSASDKIKNLEEQVQELDKKIEQIRKEITGEKPVKAGQQTANVLLKSTTQVKYLKRRSGHFFNMVSEDPEGCYFKLFDISGTSAQFEFCGNEAEAIANRDAIFDDVCEISGASHNSQNIRNDRPGNVSLQDGKWVVTTKAKIKFI
jgi:vacuolar-type H+-ATPase subunit I/STV1